MTDKDQEKEQEKEKKSVSAAAPEAKMTELDECKSKCEEYLNGWKRAKADFINYKREEFERSQELVRYAKENFLETCCRCSTICCWRKNKCRPSCRRMRT